MMKRFAIALLFGIIGYVVVAIAGYFLIVGFSSNMHDRTLEAAMTGAFVFGPLGAVTVFVITFVRVGSRSPGSQPDA